MLTAKQETFCQTLVAGNNQSDAYRLAYNVRAGTSAGTVAASASRLMADPKIAARIAEIRNMRAEAVSWTHDDSARALIAIVQADETSASAKIAAVRELNDMFGFAAEKQVAFVPAFKGMSIDDLI